MSAPAASKDLAASSLIRAFIADDPAAGVLIIEQNGCEALLIAVVRIASWCVLASNGYDVARSLAVLDQRMDVYARDGS